MTAISLQNYYMPNLANTPDGSYINTTWVRYAKPLAGGKLLLRASAPISTLGVPGSNGVVNTANGLGDINAFLSYNFVQNATTTIGAGPLISTPSSTNQLLGSGKWQTGFAVVAFIAKSPVFQYGALLTWQTSFAGQSDRESTNMAAIQPFYFWQVGNGYYFRGVPIWVFDIENKAYSVPIALGFGKVVKLGDKVFNLYAEPQYSVLVKETQPVFQVLMGINLQIM